MLHVAGTVRDAATREPLDTTRIVLRVDGAETRLSSDEAGEFHWRTDRDHRGRTLQGRAEKEGFGAVEISRLVNADELRLDFDLPRLAELVSFRVVDEDGRPVEGAEISVRAGGIEAGSTVTDATGSAEIRVRLTSPERSVELHVERAGFEDVSLAVSFPAARTGRDAPPVEIGLVRIVPPREEPPPALSWRRILAAAGAGILLAIPATLLAVRALFVSRSTAVSPGPGASTLGEALGAAFASALAEGLAMMVTFMFMYFPTAGLIAALFVQALVNERRTVHGLLAFLISPVLAMVILGIAAVVRGAVFGLAP